MKLRIVIDLDSDAMMDRPERELDTMLMFIRDCTVTNGLNYLDRLTVRDSNGVTVGTLSIEEK